ncbi:response regulator [Chloroflexales bacterium ZM16-3]|nr:response regulator [Chloroflexales bacterium ZM16-3]
MGHLDHENTPAYPKDADALRRRAKDLILIKDIPVAQTQSPEEIARIIHELQVHQIELELQNEELRRAQDELATARMRYFDLYDLAPVGYMTLSAQGMIQETNLTAATMLELPRGTLLRQPFSTFILPEDQNIYYIQHMALLREGGRQVCELRMRRPDHAPFWVRLEATAAPETSDGVAMYRVVISDITERHHATDALLHAKEAAESADRAKSNFLAHVSHEIRTPLTVIIGMASLLHNTHLSPRQREYLATIRTGVETLLTIIGNILDISKIEAGQIELESQPFDLRACLRDTLDLVAHEARRKRIALDWVVEATVPVALIGDRGRLHQVLVNLLGNAVKFTERGSVTLTAGGRPLSDATYELSLSIRDTGIGIAPEHLSQIFDPFVQADSTTTRRFGGTGLGLTISKQIIGRMGGEISVTSGHHTGSNFMIRLPLPRTDMPLAVREDAPDDSRPAAQGRLHVLLAEDNPVNQEVLFRLLENLGHTSDIVGNGAEALAAVTRQAYDVVLMDIQMPKLDGEEATRRIRALQHTAQPYIIALTASALHDDRERYLAAGMDDYLSKPVQIEDLHAALARTARRGGALPSPTAQPESASAQPNNSMQPDDLIDWPMLEHLIGSVGGGPDQVSVIVLDLFRSVLSAQMEDIADAIIADDRPRVRLLAHKLRGGSRQLGANRLSDHWESIEIASQIPGESLVETLALARHVYDKTLAQLTERLRAPGP